MIENPKLPCRRRRSDARITTALNTLEQLEHDLEQILDPTMIDGDVHNDDNKTSGPPAEANFFKRLRYFTRLFNLSQTLLGDVWDISQPSVSQYIAGNRPTLTEDNWRGLLDLLSPDNPKLTQHYADYAERDYKRRLRLRDVDRPESLTDHIDRTNGLIGKHIQRLRQVLKSDQTVTATGTASSVSSDRNFDLVSLPAYVEHTPRTLKKAKTEEEKQAEESRRYAEGRIAAALERLDSNSKTINIRYVDVSSVYAEGGEVQNVLTLVLSVLMDVSVLRMSPTMPPIDVVVFAGVNHDIEDQVRQVVNSMAPMLPNLKIEFKSGGEPIQIHNGF